MAKVRSFRRRIFAEVVGLSERDWIHAGSGMLELRHHATERDRSARRTLWARFAAGLLRRTSWLASVLGLYSLAYALHWAARRPGLFVRLRTWLRMRARVQSHEKYWAMVRERYGDG